jgi:hypothetical protein
LRFAVHGPGNPVASPRSHGVPRRNVLSGIRISVAGVSAGGTPEDGLALARLPIHLPARRTALAGVMRPDPFHPAAGFLLQTAHQQPPTRSQNLAVEPSLLTDVAAWISPRASGRSSHIPNLEVFDPDQVEPACDICAGLLRPVFLPVCLASAHPSDGQLHPRAAVGATPRRPRGRVVRVEEGGYRLNEVPQCLLLHHLRARAQPRVLGPGLGELSALLQVARRTRSAGAPVRVLFDREVPHIPSAGAVVLQHRLLTRRREQPVPCYTNKLANTTDISRGGEAVPVSGLKAGVSTPRSW